MKIINQSIHKLAWPPFNGIWIGIASGSRTTNGLELKAAGNMSVGAAFANFRAKIIQRTELTPE